jgi:hypothetical protein
MLGVIHKNSSYIEKYKESYLLDEHKAKDARPAQAQALLSWFIPNNLLFRQGKSINQERDIRTSRHPIRNASSREQMPLNAFIFMRCKTQNSSKSHLFQELKNTLIFERLFVTKMLPQMSILPMRVRINVDILQKYRYFSEIFYFYRIKYTGANPVRPGVCCPTNRFTRCTVFLEDLVT